MTEKVWFQKTEFRVLPTSHPSEEAFDQFPVWSEHYDFEEIEEIVGWGIDRDSLSEQFHLYPHCLYTLLEANPFPGRMRIFIRATITTNQGFQLKGYVMGEDVFCLAIFHNGAEFHFSRHPVVGIENQQAEVDLIQSLGITEPTLFPVRYQTDFSDCNGHVIAGLFSYRGQNINLSAADLVPVFVPSLVALLLNLEQKKGAPPTQNEVFEIRDQAVVMMVRRSMAWQLAEERGYDDLDPENCWEEFLALKQTLLSDESPEAP